jgi:hypothetical protein
MKKKAVRRVRRSSTTSEFRFDYSQAQPNRFAGRNRGKTVVVLLAPDVAKVFKDGEAVNRALRATIKAIGRG